MFILWFSVEVHCPVPTSPVTSQTILEQSYETPPPAQLAAAAASGPSSLAFTIDFGQSDGMPQITNRWTHPTPFRIHAGIQRRSASKGKDTGKEHNDACDKIRKTLKVVSSFHLQYFVIVLLVLSSSLVCMVCIVPSLHFIICRFIQVHCTAFKLRTVMNHTNGE